MTPQDIQDVMLSTSAYVDSIYLSKYAELIADNFDTVRVKYETESHHVVPNFHKLSIQRCVNLRHCDHALAHLYLALAASTDETKLKNFAAVKYILHSSNFPTREVEFIKNLQEYQQAKTDYIILNSELQKGVRVKELNPFYGKQHSEEAKRKMREHHPRLSGEQHPNYGNHLSDEAKRRIGEANRVNRQTPESIAKRFETMKANGSWNYLYDPDYHQKLSDGCKRSWEGDSRRQAASVATKSKWEDAEYRARHTAGMRGKKHKVTKKECTYCKRLISISNLRRHEMSCLENPMN